MNWRIIKYGGLLLLFLLSIFYSAFWLQKQELEVSFPTNPSREQKELICHFLESKEVRKQFDSIDGTCLGSIREWWKGEGLSEYEKRQVTNLGIYEAPSWVYGVETLNWYGFEKLKLLIQVFFIIGFAFVYFLRWPVLLVLVWFFVSFEVLSPILILAFLLGGLSDLVYEKIVERLNSSPVKGG